MKRLKYNDLLKWKDSPTRKPLIIRGARQVGKTWLMKEFGKNEYDKVVYVNLERDRHLAPLFEDGFNISRIITALQVESGFSINPKNTLIIFDEIQSVPAAISSLKYFEEDANKYHVMTAGSLLGMANHPGVSFPVGKVDFLDLHPLSFIEFLYSLNEDALINMLFECDWKLIKVYKSKYIDRLRHYYYIGGMPEPVLQFAKNNNFNEVRELQNNILKAYELDFSKHTPAGMSTRIRMVWNSIPSQLAKENRKFIYGLIRQGARAKEYESAISWLTDCGHVHKISRVSKPAYPLKAYLDISSFKLFVVDVGLLSAMTSIDAGTLIKGNEIFSEFKGSLTEQYVLQQLVSTDNQVINYWSADRSTAEVDFLIQTSGKVVPIEVKAEENLKSKSLKVYKEKYRPDLCIRTSMSDFRSQEWMINIPLYALPVINSVLKEQV
ncbi:MAG: ATP-binding protein [Bacteroidales bacterium]|nr:ATP-binding protein [Bacteroidales bacterium]